MTRTAVFLADRPRCAERRAAVRYNVGYGSASTISAIVRRRPV